MNGRTNLIWVKPFMFKPSKILTLALALVAMSAWAQTPIPPLAKIKIAADAGDPVAQDKMAEWDGANREMWYRKSAGQGYAHAQGQLGELLFLRSQLTLRVKPEIHAALGEETIKWATLAATQGDKQGQATLARIYLEGKLTKQDLIEAYKWGDLSARNSSTEFIVFTGNSSRDAAILGMKADQIHEAQKRVAAFVPHPFSKSDLPDPAGFSKSSSLALAAPPTIALP